MLTYLKRFQDQWLESAKKGRRRLFGLGWRSVLALVFLSSAASAYSAPKTVLVLGDSLSAEYGLSHGSGWVPLLEQRLKTQGIDADVVNASISGETTSGGLARLPALLVKYRPEIVVIALGANDGLRGLPLAAAEANLRTMSRQAKQAGAQVLLLGMRLPPNYGRAYNDRFFALFGKVAREFQAPLVPFMLEGVADKASLFQTDRLHPTAQAQPLILDNIWPQLHPMLTRR